MSAVVSQYASKCLVDTEDMRGAALEAALKWNREFPAFAREFFYADELVRNVAWDKAERGWLYQCPTVNLQDELRRSDARYARVLEWMWDTNYAGHRERIEFLAVSLFGVLTLRRTVGEERGS